MDIENNYFMYDGLSSYVCTYVWPRKGFRVYVNIYECFILYFTYQINFFLFRDGILRPVATIYCLKITKESIRFQGGYLFVTRVNSFFY